MGTLYVVETALEYTVGDALHDDGAEGSSVTLVTVTLSPLVYISTPATSNRFELLPTTCVQVSVEPEVLPELEFTGSTGTGVAAAVTS